MKNSVLFALCTILIFAFSASAQDANRYSSSRLDNLVNQLKRTSVDLVDRTSESIRGRNAARADIEAAFLAQQLDASVGFFQEFIRDGRRAAELRDGAGVISDLIRRVPSSGLNNNLWRDAQRSVDDISRELGENNNGNNGNNNNGNNSPSSGRAFWRGNVDKEVQLIIQGRNIETRTMSGADYSNNVSSSFTSTLPRRNVRVEVIKKGGRGQVRVVEQPNRDNDYTAVVQILDDDSGAREYQLEIVWQ